MSELDKYKVNGQKQRPRVPMHKQKPLSVGELEGYHLHIMNDVLGERERMELAGYTAVTEKELDRCDKDLANGKHLGSDLKLTINKRAGADAYTATVMKIPLEWWEADQKERLAENNKKIEEIDPTNHSVNGSTYGSLKCGLDNSEK